MTYFNANVDTLYIGPSTSDRTTSIYLSALFPTETLGNLKFLAIAAEENPWYDKEVLESLPVAFPALQLLTAVCVVMLVFGASVLNFTKIDLTVQSHCIRLQTIQNFRKSVMPF
jgi:hypothetical protein